MSAGQFKSESDLDVVCRASCRNLDRHRVPLHADTGVIIERDLRPEPALLQDVFVLVQYRDKIGQFQRLQIARLVGFESREIDFEQKFRLIFYIFTTAAEIVDAGKHLDIRARALLVFRRKDGQAVSTRYQSRLRTGLCVHGSCPADASTGGKRKKSDDRDTFLKTQTHFSNRFVYPFL